MTEMQTENPTPFTPTEEASRRYLQFVVDHTRLTPRRVNAAERNEIQAVTEFERKTQ